jgi:putative tricarboxylic transport membrane protein
VDLLSNLAMGFGTALAPVALLYCFFGCLLGTLVGVLPAIGPATVIAMLLPATHAMPPAASLMLMAGIYYGVQYSGSTAAILANRPGASSSVVTCIDGHQMALQDRAGAALAVAGWGSFFAGAVGTLVVAVCAYPVAVLAFQFGPAEYFSLIAAALVGTVVLASGPIAKALAMVVLGLLLGLVGSDVSTGLDRFTFGSPALADSGRFFAIVAMGVFAYGEVISRLQRPQLSRNVVAPIGNPWPTVDDIKATTPAVLRGTVIGSVLGVLPGGGALLASFASYAIEKSMPARPGEIEFGKGNIRGVAAPESANNAGAQTSFITLLTLGIPPNAVMGLMVGAMTIHHIQPGPQVMTSNPQLFWGLIASMWIGNVMLLVLNLPLAGLWARLLRAPFRWLVPVVVLLCALGVYTVDYRAADVWMVAGFGVVGYVFFKLGCEPAPLILGFILGPTMEEHLRRALQLSHGDWSVFVTRPLSAGLLAGAAVLLAIVALPSIKSKRQSTFAGD